MNTSKTRHMALFFTYSMICLLARLLPFRPLQTSLTLAVQMPMSRQWGGVMGFVFGFINMISFDLITGSMGWWTLITATSYGMLAYLIRICINTTFTTRYLYAAVVATLSYDILTGIIFGPWLFGQSLFVTCIGQIPFTIMHLIANVTFSSLLSPHLETVMQKEVVVSPSLRKEQKTWQMI